jgi:hypothetical protein
MCKILSLFLDRKLAYLFIYLFEKRYDPLPILIYLWRPLFLINIQVLPPPAHRLPAWPFFYAPCSASWPINWWSWCMITRNTIIYGASSRERAHTICYARDIVQYIYRERGGARRWGALANKVNLFAPPTGRLTSALGRHLSILFIYVVYFHVCRGRSFHMNCIAFLSY